MPQLRSNSHVLCARVFLCLVRLAKKNVRSYRGDLSLMALLPWRSDSGVLGLLLVIPDHQHTGGRRVKEDKDRRGGHTPATPHKHTHGTRTTDRRKRLLPGENAPRTPVLLQGYVSFNGRDY